MHGNVKTPRIPVPVSGNGTKRVGNGTKRVSGGWVGGNAGERQVSNSGNVFCNLKGTILCNIGFPDLDLQI